MEASFIVSTERLCYHFVSTASVRTLFKIISLANGFRKACLIANKFKFIIKPNQNRKGKEKIRQVATVAEMINSVFAWNVKCFSMVLYLI